MAKDFTTDLSKRKKHLLDITQQKEISVNEIVGNIEKENNQINKGINVNKLLEEGAPEPRLNVTCSLAFSHVQKLDQVARQKGLKRAEVLRRILDAAITELS